MPYALDNEITVHCRGVFLECPQFSSHERLRAVFITTALVPFKYKILETQEIDARVDLFLGRVLEWRLGDGQCVLLAFLEQLIRLNAQDEFLADRLRELLTAVGQNLQFHDPASAAATSMPSQVWDEVQKLDFVAQGTIARPVLDNERIAALLIHGPQRSGQRILVTRFCNHKDRWGKGRRIRIDLGAGPLSSGADRVLDELRARAGLGEAAPWDWDRAFRLVRNWLRTQDVLFVFHNVDYLPDATAECLQAFWVKLIIHLHGDPEWNRANTQLFLFLVDYRGEVVHSGSVVVKEQFTDPSVPISLPQNARVPRAELERWLSNAGALLPAGLTVDLLLANTDNGLLDGVFYNIRRHCRDGEEWERWLA